MKKLNNIHNECDLYELLLYGGFARVKIKSGKLGCSDLQDAQANGEELILFQKEDSYLINTKKTGENLLCVSDYGYIKSIVHSFEEQCEAGFYVLYAYKKLGMMYVILRCNNLVYLRVGNALKMRCYEKFCSEDNYKNIIGLDKKSLNSICKKPKSKPEKYYIDLAMEYVVGMFSREVLSGGISYDLFISNMNSYLKSYADGIILSKRSAND